MKKIILAVSVLLAALPSAGAAGVLINGNQINPASSVNLASGTFSGTLSAGGALTAKGVLVVVGSATVQGATFFQGNVGISTSSPVSKFMATNSAGTVGAGLDVVGGGTFDSNFQLLDRTNSAARDYWIGVGNTAFGDFSINQGATLGGTVAASVSRFYIGAGGGIGMGTTSPPNPLYVSSNTSGAASLSSNFGAMFSLDSIVTNLSMLQIGEASASPYAWYLQAKDDRNNGTSFPIALNPAGGPVLIGTATARDFDAFNGYETINGAASSAIYLTETNTGTHATIGHTASVNYLYENNNLPWTIWTNGIERMRIPSAGVTTGSGLCLDASKHLGVCTSVLGVGGTCTCTAN